MARAVIFDFDGIISNSEPLHYKAFAGALAKFSFELSEELYYRDYVGYSDTECIENIIKNFPDKLNMENLNQLIETKMQLFKEIIVKEKHLFDGVPEFIKMVQQNGLYIAICSGACRRDIELMLNDTGLQDHFQVIVSEDDVIKGKPDPEGYILALNKLNKKNNINIKPEQCIVIEDSRWGLQAAIDARMHTIAVANTYPANELTIAEKVVASLTDVGIEDLLELSRI